MNVLHVIGSRSGFFRLSPVVRALRATTERQLLVFAGDRHDLMPEERFLADLDMPEPDFVLGGRTGSPAMRTGRAVIALEPIVSRSSPDCIFAVGDVDAALAAALVARKSGIPLAHLEAGVRSGDETASAEINRLLTDRLSDVLFTEARDASVTLESEGIPADRIHLVGNVVADAVDQVLERSGAVDLPDLAELDRGSYIVALFRPETEPDPDRLAGLLVALDDVAHESGRTTLLVMEPELSADVRRHELEHLLAPLHVVEPLGYADFLGLAQGAAVVVTDTTEIPDVCTLLGIPCVVVGREPLRGTYAYRRENGMITGDPKNLVEVTRMALDRTPEPFRPDLWDGLAAERIADVTATRIAAPVR